MAEQLLAVDASHARAEARVPVAELPVHAVQGVGHGVNGVHHKLNLSLLLVAGVTANFLQTCQRKSERLEKRKNKRSAVKERSRIKGNIKGTGKEMRAQPRALGSRGDRDRDVCSTSDKHIFLSGEEVRKVSVKDTGPFLRRRRVHPHFSFCRHKQLLHYDWGFFPPLDFLLLLAVRRRLSSAPSVCHIPPSNYSLLFSCRPQALFVPLSSHLQASEAASDPSGLQEQNPEKTPHEKRRRINEVLEPERVCQPSHLRLDASS